MEMYLLIPLLCCIVIIIILWSSSKKKTQRIKEIEVAKTNELKNYFREEWNREENELNNRIRLKREAIDSESAKLESEFKLNEKEFVNQLKNLQIQLNEKEARYIEVNQDLDLYKKGKIKEIDSAAAEYEQRKRLENAKTIEEHNNSMKEASAELQDQLLRAEQVLKDRLEKVKLELEEERSKRAAINEEILRQRAVEEQQDFYRIQLPEEDKEDIEILRSVIARLRHPEAINKVIWTGYYQKPLAELRKRAGIEGSGVYKITRMKTGEIYIGQAVNVSTRWAEHCKSALGVGTLASSQLHRVMKQDGCENFLFELLEEVPKDKLRERESYYIDFYDSKNYGLNTISGDKNK